VGRSRNYGVISARLYVIVQSEEENTTKENCPTEELLLPGRAKFFYHYSTE
jgi:hypothetical protein